MSESRNYNGYTLFDDVEDVDLQAYNRAICMRNISTDLGSESVKEYTEMLTTEEQLAAVHQLADIAGMAV